MEKQQAVAGHFDKRKGKKKRGVEKGSSIGLKPSLKGCTDTWVAPASKELSGLCHWRVSSGCLYVQLLARYHKINCAIFRSIPYVKRLQLASTVTISSWGNSRRWSRTPVTASSCASLGTVSMATAFSKVETGSHYRTLVMCIHTVLM